MLSFWLGPLPPLSRQNWEPTLTHCSTAQLQLGTQNRSILVDPRTGRLQPVRLNRPGGTANYHRRARAKTSLYLSGRQLG